MVAKSIPFLCIQYHCENVHRVHKYTKYIKSALTIWYQAHEICNARRFLPLPLANSDYKYHVYTTLLVFSALRRVNVTHTNNYIFDLLITTLDNYPANFFKQGSLQAAGLPLWLCFERGVLRSRCGTISSG